MKAQRTSGGAVLAASSGLALVTLTGCPLSDDYFIDDAIPGGGATTAGASSSGGSGASGNSSGGSGASDSGSCSPSTCGGACCDGVCVDLANDAANCGKCSNVCSSGRPCSVGTCSEGWLPIAPPPAQFVPREKAAYTTFSDKVFIWGGLNAKGEELRNGAIYDPVQDSWQLIMEEPAAPSARELATAVWTGNAVLVFGGRVHGDMGMALRDAALYDPVANRWGKVRDNPTGRVAPIAAVYNGMAVFWSGLSAGLIPLGGADRYRVSADEWAASTTVSGPSRLGHTACAGIGDSFFVYGGIDSTLTGTDKAYRYSFGTNSWSTLSRGPSARWEAFGATDGTSFYVWGGRDAKQVRSDGSRYDNEWVAIDVRGAPSPRYAPLRESGWTFTLDEPSFAVLGGLGTNANYLHDGGRYMTATDSWASIPAWTSSEDHAFGVAVLAAGELIVFGGRTGSTLTNTGERFALSGR